MSKSKTSQGRYCIPVSHGIPSCPKERQLGPLPSGVGPTSPTARGSGSANSASSGTGSRSLHARVAELNKKMEEIFKSSKTPKFQEILFLGEEELGGDENVDVGCFFDVCTFLEQKVMIVLLFLVAAYFL